MPMHIGHVALQVTDLERTVEHAQRTLGLKVTEATAEAAYLTANDKRHELQLISGDRAGMDHVGLEVEHERELDALRDRVIAAGATILSEQPEEPGLAAAIRCVAPGGVVLELYTGMEREPLSLDNVLQPIAQKISHVTLGTEDKPELETFLLDVLGFRVSDQVGGVVTWMRCDTDHHGMAVAAIESGSRMHHYAFELESWSSIGAYADRIARDGQKFLWGPGRHGPGFNIFTYLSDPDGVVVEACADLLRIDNDAIYRPIDWDDNPNAMNLWGPDMPDGWRDLGVPVLTPALRSV
jgi:catechol 2,3-dioxygenase